MGKWYSHSTYSKHKADLRVSRNDKLHDIFPHVLTIANTFPRQSIATGALDLNDLVQAGHEGLIRAWQKVDWERINASNNPDGELWTYLKNRIKWSIRREIDKHSQHISTPINIIEYARRDQDYYGVDRVLTNIFPEFFDKYFRYVEDNTPYISVQLEALIDDALHLYVKSVENRQILLEYYGVGTPRLSQIELAEKYRKSVSNIQNIMLRTRNKLKTTEFEKIIENFYQNL